VTLNGDVHSLTSIGASNVAKGELVSMGTLPRVIGRLCSRIPSMSMRRRARVSGEGAHHGGGADRMAIGGP
jgi:hypothetical protein